MNSTGSQPEAFQISDSMSLCALVTDYTKGQKYFVS